MKRSSVQWYITQGSLNIVAANTAADRLILRKDGFKVLSYGVKNPLMSNVHT